jgi:hypothetical protein
MQRRRSRLLSELVQVLVFLALMTVVRSSLRYFRFADATRCVLYARL